jgi:hypothetical protein
MHGVRVDYVPNGACVRAWCRARIAHAWPRRTILYMYNLGTAPNVQNLRRFGKFADWGRYTKW